MTARLDKLELLARDEIVAPPQIDTSAGCTDRNFGLPSGLLLGVFGLFMAYLVVMSIGFMADGLVLPMAVNFIFVAAFAYVPAKWAMMKPGKTDRALSWDRLMAQGVDTLTGHSSGGETAVLVLLLPACVFLWGVAVTLIAALS